MGLPASSRQLWSMNRGDNSAELALAAKRLDDLVAELEQRGFAARVLATSGKLRLWVQNLSASQLSDAVYAAPDPGGAWWLWWSWGDRIAPIADVETAAFKIGYVLASS
jgi:hypothetical protein